MRHNQKKKRHKEPNKQKKKKFKNNRLVCNKIFSISFLFRFVQLYRRLFYRSFVEHQFFSVFFFSIHKNKILFRMNEDSSTTENSNK